jgi:hypothetical protein
MKNQIGVITVDTHRDGAVWVAVGRSEFSGTKEYHNFKNYPCFVADVGRRQRFMERAQRAQVALFERSER